MLTARARRLAVTACIVAAAAAVARSPQPTLGPQFTADRARVLSTADSMLRAHGGDPAGWRRLTSTAKDTLGPWPRFLREFKLIPQAQRFASTYLPPAWWVVRYVHTTGTAAQRTEEWRVRLWPNGKPLDARHLIPDSAHRATTPSAEVRRIALAALVREGVNTATLQETDFRERALPARQDVTVSYTDTAVKLPAGAAAKAWVHVAGDEPLLARRGIELPETFLRADRERQTSRAMLAGLCALLLIGGIVAGAIVVTRRRAMLLHDGVLDRRGTFMLVSGLVVFAVLGDLNGLPSALFSYDTSEPWTRFLGTTALGFVSAIPLALTVVGFWFALGALRRRVGIPMLAGPASGVTSNDMVIAGLGLGGLVYMVSRVSDLVPSKGMPRAPSTLLNDAVPLLGGLASLPSATMMIVALLGIPMLVVAGITPKWTMRALLSAVMLALLISAMVALAPANDVDVLRVVALVAMMAVVALAFNAWSTISAWSWIVAALALQGLGGLRQAVHAPTWQPRVASALLAAFACLLIVLIARRTRSETPTT